MAVDPKYNLMDSDLLSLDAEGIVQSLNWYIVLNRVTPVSKRRK